MAKFQKTVEVEAITFKELIEYGKENGGNIVNGMPWSFKYKGHPVTHESDEFYIVLTPKGVFYFTPNDMLITETNGEIYPCKLDVFRETYRLFARDWSGEES